MKVKSTNHTPPALDADLREIARLLHATDWRLHLAHIALELGAIDAADFAMVRLAARMGELDDLNTEAGRRAWKILAPWLPDEVQN